MKRSTSKPKKTKSKKLPITHPISWGWGWVEYGKLYARTSAYQRIIVQEHGITDHADDHPHADDDHYPVKVVICTIEEWERREAELERLQKIVSAVDRV